jgi:hypothetical protein
MLRPFGVIPSVVTRDQGTGKRGPVEQDTTSLNRLAAVDCMVGVENGSPHRGFVGRLQYEYRE